MDFLTRFKGKTSTIGKDGVIGLVAGIYYSILIILGKNSNDPYTGNSNVTVMTNIDNARNSQINYNKPKVKAPATQYGPYSELQDPLTTNGYVDHNQFEVMSAGGKPMYRSPQTMQEFQYSNSQSIDVSLSEPYSAQKNLKKPSYHQMKDKLTNMRKQNMSNVATNILNSSKGGQPSKDNTKAQNLKGDKQSVQNPKVRFINYVPKQAYRLLLMLS